MVYVNLRNEKKITWAKYLTAMSINKKFVKGLSLGSAASA